MAVVFPKILKCDAAKCTYNFQEKCRTLAVNIGGPEPMCDTFAILGKKGGIKSMVAKVGACKVGQCVHNKSFECTATGIKVGLEGSKAECLMFKQ